MSPVESLNNNITAPGSGDTSTQPRSSASAFTPTDAKSGITSLSDTLTKRPVVDMTATGDVMFSNPGGGGQPQRQHEVELEKENDSIGIYMNNSQIIKSDRQSISHASDASPKTDLYTAGECCLYL